jgi:hypothetical protein
VQHLCVFELHLYFEEEEAMALFAAAQVVLVCHPRHLGTPLTTPSQQHDVADVVGEDAAVLATDAGILLLGTSSSRFKKRIGIIMSRTSFCIKS